MQATPGPSLRVCSVRSEVVEAGQVSVVLDLEVRVSPAKREARISRLPSTSPLKRPARVPSAKSSLIRSNDAALAQDLDSSLAPRRAPAPLATVQVLARLSFRADSKWLPHVHLVEEQDPQLPPATIVILATALDEFVDERKSRLIFQQVWMMVSAFARMALAMCLFPVLALQVRFTFASMLHRAASGGVKGRRFSSLPPFLSTLLFSVARFECQRWMGRWKCASQQARRWARKWSCPEEECLRQLAGVRRVIWWCNSK